MNNLKSILNSLYPGYNSYLTGRGTTALFVVLSLLAKTEGVGEVIVPATVCPSVPLAVRWAGHTLRFCDTDPNTMCLSIDSLVPLLSHKTRAVVAVHLFGKTAPLSDLMALREKWKFKLIEDLAQSIGGSNQGQNLGTFGDFSFISFDRIKILDGHGGVLLSRDSEYNENINLFVQQLKSASEESKGELALSFRNLTTGLQDLARWRNSQEIVNFDESFFDVYSPLFLYAHDGNKESEEKMFSELSRLPEKKGLRQRNYHLYQEYLKPVVPYVRFLPEEMPWRLPLLLPDHASQLKLLHDLRSADFLVSNHYFPASVLFNDHTCLKAFEIGMTALNFWVDELTQIDKIEWACQQVNTCYQ